MREKEKVSVLLRTEFCNTVRERAREREKVREGERERRRDRNVIYFFQIRTGLYMHMLSKEALLLC